MNTLPVTLLHTNDMHGRLEALARLSSFARRLRAELRGQGRHVFLLDAGDAADRFVPFVGISKGALFPPVLEAAGYDAQTLGNAVTITYGPQAAEEMAARARLPLLAANFFQGERPLVAGVRPYVQFPLTGGLQLTVLGLTVHAPDIYALFGIDAPHYLDAARYWLERIPRRGPLLALTHLGLREDRQLAEACPELDAILGGHSHTRLAEGELANGVLIAQTGEYAASLGRVDLEIDAASGAVLSKRAALLPVPDDEPPDPAVLRAVQAAEREAEALLAQPVTRLAEPLELEHFAESSLADLAADAVRERMGAEIGLLTGALLNRGLPAGAVTQGDLNACSHSTANPQLSALRGEQVRAALERALDPDFMHARIKVFRGAPVGLPAVSGMVVEWDPGAPEGSRVQRVRVNGQPLEAQRVYRVAHTDAEVREQGQEFGYFFLEEGQLLRTEVPTIVREFIAGYLIAHEPAGRPAGGRLLRAG